MRISMFALMGKNVETMGLFFIKLYLWCAPVNVHNMDTDWLAFRDNKELSLSILDYLMHHSMMGEKDSDESFPVLCQSWKMRYFDGNGIKITLLNPNEDIFREIIV